MTRRKRSPKTDPANDVLLGLIKTKEPPPDFQQRLVDAGAGPASCAPFRLLSEEEIDRFFIRRQQA